LVEARTRAKFIIGKVKAWHVVCCCFSHVVCLNKNVRPSPPLAISSSRWRAQWRNERLRRKMVGQSRCSWRRWRWRRCPRGTAARRRRWWRRRWWRSGWWWVQWIGVWLCGGSRGSSVFTYLSLRGPTCKIRPHFQ
jgi:hypothetical protein